VDWTDFLGGFIGFLFEILAALVSIIISPVDALVNAIVPQATDAIEDFFGFVITMIQSLNDFLEWFFYVLGIQPVTWHLMMLVVMALLLTWIFLFPIKMVISVFRGMKG